ncbi:MAG: deoxyuridine 5'-triphosphate nucleotidohydrolase [Candidatus Omnitrophica bacterium]|nr:deoxyuridine 5'-triphosphate nucleotidohydrolase [Candidatus Omnitrophota bacterium]
MILNQEQIRALIQEKQLISNFIHLETQLTPNGFDLTVAKISYFSNQGALDFSNKERVLADYKEVSLTKDDPKHPYGWWILKPGIYKVLTNEIVSLPCDLVAVACPRSSLLRMGAFTVTAVWDAGFSGKSEFVLVVGNPQGLRIKQNARITQLIFIPVKETKAYEGIYKNLV